MAERYPGYDVLAKRDTPSWDEVTRRVVAERLAVEDRPQFLDGQAWATLKGLCERIIPQQPEAETGRQPAPLAAYVDRKLLHNRGEGYRRAELPPLRECWTRGLAALDAEAEAAYLRPFTGLPPQLQHRLVEQMANGELTAEAWGGMRCQMFFADRAAPDVVRAYYAHPNAWSEIGFGGPASPRGYVRLEFDRRDPWEASEGRPGREGRTERENRHVGR
jgi:hypothetical protein